MTEMEQVSQHYSLNWSYTNLNTVRAWMQSKIAIVRSLAERPAETLRAFTHGYVVPGTQFEVVYNALHDRCPAEFLDGTEKIAGGASWAAPDYCELF